VRDLMERLSVETTDARCPLDPAFGFSDRVVLELRDGRKLDSGEIRFARGNSQLPLRDDELRAKFMDCANVAGYADAAALFDQLSELGSLASVGELAMPRQARRAA